MRRSCCATGGRSMRRRTGAPTEDQKFSGPGLMVLVLSTSTVAAQQPQAPVPERHRPTAGQGKMSMMMDSLNHRLDSADADEPDQRQPEGAGHGGGD